MATIGVVRHWRSVWPSLPRAAWAQIKAWWRGDLSLWAAVRIGALLFLVVHLAWWALTEYDDGPLYFSAGFGHYAAQTVLNLVLMLAWALPTLRVCLHRLQQPRSLTLTFVAFMTALSLLLYGVVGQARNGAELLRVHMADDIDRWTPLEVYADAALGRIVAKGDITPGSADRLEAMLRNNPQYRVLQLESYGGRTAESDRMVALVTARKLSTVSFERCSSACTDVFLAGEMRFLGPQARFGFHRSGYPGMPRNAAAQEFDLRHAQWMRQRGVAEAFVQTQLGVSHYDIWKPNQQELFAANFATHRWAERPTGW